MSLEPSFFVPEEGLVEKLINEFNIDVPFEADGSDGNLIDNVDVFATVRDGILNQNIDCPAFMRFLTCMQAKTQVNTLIDEHFPAFIAACHYYFG